MAHASLYPGFIKLFYTVSNLQHIATLPVLPFLAISAEWFVEEKGGGAGVLWTTALDAYVTTMRPFLAAGTATIDFAELWTIETVEDDPVFQETHEVALAGTAGTSTVIMAQAVLTQRTQAGGILRTYVMEPAIAANLQANPPTYAAIGPFAGMANFMQGSTGFVVGRDGSFPVSGIKARTKTNDALRHKRQLFS